MRIYTSPHVHVYKTVDASVWPADPPTTPLIGLATRNSRSARISWAHGCIIFSLRSEVREATKEPKKGAMDNEENHMNMKQVHDYERTARNHEG